MVHSECELDCRIRVKKFTVYLLMAALGILQCVGTTSRALGQTGTKSKGSPAATDETEFSTQAREISYRSEDGWEIKGTLHTPTIPGNRRVPAVVLLHSSEHEQQVFGDYAYPGLAVSLAKRGVVALRIDWRGRGKSIGSLEYHSFTSEQRNKIYLDTKGAINFLAAQSGVDPQRIGVVGEAEGANFGVLGAVGDARVRVLALLSGRLEPKAKEYIGENPQLGLLCLVSTEDQEGFRDMTEAYNLSQNPDKDILVERDMGVGTTMFQIYRTKFPKEKPLDIQVADWVAKQLKGLGEEKETSFQSTDGFTIYGDLRLPDSATEGNKVPGVVMVHSGTRDRYIFQNLENLVAKQGIAVYNIDWRGRGRSRERGIYFDFPADVQDRAYQDVQGAINFLAAQNGVDANHIGVVGATLGARLAARATIGDRRVKAVILISGAGDEAFKKFLTDRPDLAVFCVGSRGDSGPLQAMLEIHRLSKNPESQIIVYGNADRSSQIFQAEPDLEPRLAEWFKDTLVPDPSTANP
jgi:dienelactone hydrolase